VSLAGSAAVVAAGILAAGHAGARPGQLVQLSGAGACVSQLDTVGLCATGRGLNAPDTIAVSPDGRSVYVASFGVSAEVAGNPGAIATFARRAADGRISQPAGTRGCIGAAESGCAPSRALDGASGVAVSPDGRNVYVSALVSGAVAVFARGSAGGLAPLGCVSDGGDEGCTPGRALEQPTDLAVSRDGRNVYVASFGSRAVASFARGANGQLAQLGGTGGCVGVSDGSGGTPGCAAGRGLTNPNGLTLSPDGTSAYVLSDDALAVFRRGSSGALTQLGDVAGCFSADGSDGACAAYPSLLAAIDVTVSPDGRNVYVATYSPGAVLVFRRNVSTGALAPLVPVTAGLGLDGVADLAVSPDGRNVYAASPFSDAVLAFARAPDGRLGQLPDEAACVGDAEAGTGCAAGEVLTRAGSLAISPDSRHVYVASVQAVGPSCACGEELGSLSVFAREVAARLTLQPSPPGDVRAGAAFTLRQPLDTNVTAVEVACTARVGTRPVRTTARYGPGVAICAAQVPPGTAGMRLTVMLRVKAAGLVRTRVFSLPIRRSA
jgi:DNA-binding beta-propeller fold protein YncE